MKTEHRNGRTAKRLSFLKGTAAATVTLYWFHPNDYNTISSLCLSPCGEGFGLCEGALLVPWKWVYLFNRVIAHLSQLVFKQLLWSTLFPLIAKLLLNWRTLSRLVQSFRHWQALWSQAVNCILKRIQKRVLQNSKFKMLAVVQWRQKPFEG